MNSKQKKVDRKLLKDIKRATTLEAKAQATDTYRCFRAACSVVV